MGNCIIRLLNENKISTRDSAMWLDLMYNHSIKQTGEITRKFSIRELKHISNLMKYDLIINKNNTFYLNIFKVILDN